jgi:hypothetical protein
LPRETARSRDDAHAQARQAESPASIRGWRLQARPFPASRPLATSQASYNRYVQGRETAASRAKAATLTTLKRDLGKEKVGHLDRQKLIDYG